MGGVLGAFTTIKTLIEDKESEEELALYGGGRYLFYQEYKNWYAPSGILGPWKGGSST